MLPASRLLFATLIAVLSTSGPVSAATLTSTPMFFRDDSGRGSMSVRATAGSSQFTFSVPSLGRYSGSVPTSVTQDNEGLHFVGDVDASFTPATTAAARPTTIHLDGKVDLIHGRANINLWDGETRYEVVTAVVPLGDVEPTTQAALGALGTNDWPALYTLLGADVAATYTQDQFTTMMTSAGLPAFVDAVVVGPPRNQALGGTAFAVQPITLRALSNGTFQTYSATLQFITNEGTWHLFSITTPVAV